MSSGNLSQHFDSEPPRTEGGRSGHRALRARRRRISIDGRTLLVGVVNITPDSFYDGGRYLDSGHALEQAFKLVQAGADILDIGAESSRPGAHPVSADEEIRRLKPVLSALRPHVTTPIMVDTYKASVARAALDLGADFVNDISSFRDPDMPAAIKEYEAGVVLVHMRGTPRDMQRIPPSDDIWHEVLGHFDKTLKTAADFGISSDSIVLDPGIGFGKTVSDNLTLLNRLSRLERFDLPILVGTSRKTFIGKILGIPPQDRLWGTAASVVAAIMRGAHLVRVHDVREIRQVVTIADSILAERSLG